ncbi:ABC transporter ATP-binding protein [Marinilactibacillus sp. Marseille-P9653]|uniref:ABC transporter ATP-binding protein n=1 Tax=Marinilactibacillus sp. Marseille-P9653 TaxID=2866583 RepID=UPI001CE3B716|nr:ABC transporter ATP-binding protein [Marinilactibacillus sp. Marseille-P9653]
MPKKKEKLKTSRAHVLKRLWSYLFNYKWMLITATILMVTSNGLSLIGPYLSGLAIDSIQPGTGNVLFQRVFYIVGLMAIFFVLSSILEYVMQLLMIKLTQRTIRRLRRDVFNKMAELPVGFFDKHQTGDIISRITYDIDTINQSLQNDFIQIVTSAITIVGSLTMMLLISPILTLVFGITLPISIFLTKFMVTRFRPLFKKRSVKLGELNGYVEEMISGQQTIKAYNQEENMIMRFDEKNEEAVSAYYNADYYGSMIGPSINFINNLSLSLVSVAGALLYLFNYLTLGGVSSFVLYSRRFSGPINELANIISELQSAFAAAERVFLLMDEPSEARDILDAHVYDQVEGNVEMNHVDFGYTSEKMTIHDLNFEAPSGNVIAVVGPTGAGKTTLVNLLMRFYDPSAGSIELDTVDTTKATRESLRTSYAMVLQDTWLFSGTIFENLAYGKENVTEEEVEEAAKTAQIHDYIMGLPNGYQTVIDQEGLNISQGQKQLLTIARAMILDANLLILDEATSNVDTQTEMKIQEAMQKLMNGKTSFVIAHRLSTIRNADTILVVQDGRIVEQGNHDDLLEKEGLYSDLYHSQFENVI